MKLSVQQARVMKFNQMTDDIQDALKSIEFQIKTAIKYGEDSRIALINNYYYRRLTSKARSDIIQELRSLGYKARWSVAHSNGIYISWESPVTLIDKFKNIFVT